MSFASLRPGIVRAVVASLLLGVVSSFGDWLWARYIPDGAATPLPIAGLTLAGVWGSLYPRHGFTQHDSPPVAAALLGWRAMTIALNPAPGPGGLSPHITVAPAIGEPPVCFQVGYPSDLGT